MNKSQGRDILIHRICWAIMKKRLQGMRAYIGKLRAMSDDDLFKEYNKRGG